MNHQVLSRLQGERRAQLSLLRLLCVASVWRTAATRLLPQCGASAWWVTLCCLLPGFGAALLLRFSMHLTQTRTLMECIRACLGKTGVWIASWTLAALLLLDGAASITALVTLFTEGVGTRGTQFTLALLTGTVLLCSLHREGLPRAAGILRWGMAAAAVLIGAFLLADARMDHLFPLWGEGRSDVLAALQAGAGMAWPVALLLTAEPCGACGRLRSGVVPVLYAAGALLLITLAIPHELLMTQTGLAGSLLIGMRYLPGAVRIVAQCLLMLGFFLGIGASAQLAASSLSVTGGAAWLPAAFTAALILTQAADVSRLWGVLEAVGPWLLAPVLLLGLLCLPVGVIRRRMR